MPVLWAKKRSCMAQNSHSRHTDFRLRQPPILKSLRDEIMPPRKMSFNFPLTMNGITCQNLASDKLVALPKFKEQTNKFHLFTSCLFVCLFVCFWGGKVKHYMKYYHPFRLCTVKRETLYAAYGSPRLLYIWKVIYTVHKKV